MAKKNKVRRLRSALAVPAKKPGAAATKRTGAKKGTAAKKATIANQETSALAAKSASGARASKKAAGSARKAAAASKNSVGKNSVGKNSPGKRPLGRISLTAPLARARKLSGDLYQSAGLSIWAEAVEAAPEPDRAALIQLQDAMCDAADLLRDAKAINPKHLRLYWVACFDREGLPVTPPRFITAAHEDEALKIFRTAFKGEYGRRQPRAHPVPALAERPALHDSEEPMC